MKCKASAIQDASLRVARHKAIWLRHNLKVSLHRNFVLPVQTILQRSLQGVVQDFPNYRCKTFICFRAKIIGTIIFPLLTMLRPSGRAVNQLRPIEIVRNYTKYAEGAVRLKMGETTVLCTASVEEKVPAFLKGQGKGWVTAEYGMLPRSTHSRVDREAARGKQSGRTQEIQRLIGRALRTSVNLTKLGERSILIDCDVIQADGGTRTASITAAYVALHDAISHLLMQGVLPISPIINSVAAVSVGIYQGTAILDLDYQEDSRSDIDMNVVMTGEGNFVEIQGTAEGATFDRAQLNTLLDLASTGIAELICAQQRALSA